MIIGLCQVEVDLGWEQCEQRLVVTSEEWQKHRRGSWRKGAQSKARKSSSVFGQGLGEP